MAFHFKSKRIQSSFHIYVSIIFLGLNTHANHYYHLQEEIKITDGFIGRANDFSIEILEVKKNKTNYQYNAKIKSIGQKKRYTLKNKISVLIYSKDSLLFNPGQKYSSILKIKKIKDNANPGVTDFKKIYALQNIFYTANLISVKPTLITEPNQKLQLKKYFQKVQTKLASILKIYLGNNHKYSILSALVLGDKSTLSKDLKSVFVNTGSIHILAVSGLHVGIIYSILLFITYWVPKNKVTKFINLKLSLILIVGYCLITGSSTSVTRSALMLSIYLIGNYFGKFTNINNIIGAVALTILLVNPISIYTISFQFSFLALISIIYFNPFLDLTKNKNWKPIKYFSNLITVSFSAQILIAPLLIYNFHQISIYFWLSGIVAIPLAFIILISTILLLIFHLVKLTLIAELISKVVSISTEYLYQSVLYISNLPHCSITDIHISKSDMICIYLCLTGIMLFLKYKKKAILHCTIIILIINSLYLGYSKKNIWKTHELIVYHLYKKSYISYTHNGNINEILKQNIDHENLNNLLFKFINTRRIKAYKWKNQSSQTKKFCIQNKIIYINPLNLKPKENIDILILTHYHDNIIEFLLTHKFEKIILDGNIDYFKKNEIIKQLNKLQIDFHDTSQSGAFIYKF